MSTGLTVTIEEVRFPSTLSKAVADESEYVEPRSALIGETSFRVMTGGSVSIMVEPLAEVEKLPAVSKARIFAYHNPSRSGFEI